MRTLFFVLCILHLLKLPAASNSDSFCHNPPVPNGATFIRATDSSNESRLSIRYRCNEGLHLVGDDVIQCEGGNWIGSVPTCSADVAPFKPTFQSTQSTLSNKPVQPKSFNITKHNGKNCARTSLEDKTPWWKIDLLVPVFILAINITFATDTPMPKSVEIRVGNDSDYHSNPLCNWIGSKSKTSSTFILTSCVEELTGRFLSLSAFNTAGTPLTICHIKILTSQTQSDRSCYGPIEDITQNPGIFVLNNKCFIRGQGVKLSFNESIRFCSNYGLGMLTNRDPISYGILVSLENDDRSGRKVVWLGSKMSPLDGKWYWLPEENHSNSSGRNNESLLTQFLWGLHEPSGEDCIVVDSALKWRWNSVRCVISAGVICEGGFRLCSSPDVNAGSKLIYQNVSNLFPVGSEVKYECPEGFRLIGPKSRSCQNDGKWSDEAPTCIFHDCGFINGSDELVIDYDSGNQTVFGSTARLTCSKNFIGDDQFREFGTNSNLANTKKSVETTCESDGWTINELKCYKFSCNLTQKDDDLSIVLELRDGQIFATNFSCFGSSDISYLDVESLCVDENSTWSPPLPTCQQTQTTEGQTEDCGESTQSSEDTTLTTQVSEAETTMIVSTTKRPQFKTLPPNNSSCQKTIDIQYSYVVIISIIFRNIINSFFNGK